MKALRNLVVPLIAFVLTTGLALNFSGCTQQSPMQPGDNAANNSIATLTYPQYASRTFKYEDDQTGYQGGNMVVAGGSIFHFQNGAFTPPPGTALGESVTLTILVEYIKHDDEADASDDDDGDGDDDDGDGDDDDGDGDDDGDDGDGDDDDGDGDDDDDDDGDDDGGDDDDGDHDDGDDDDGDGDDDDDDGDDENEAKAELRFTFGPSGSRFNPPAEAWFDWSDLGVSKAKLYYITNNGEYIELKPDEIDSQGHRFKFYIHHFSRYAVAWSN